MDEPGPVIGTGRAAHVYDIGNGRVLRRYLVAPPAGTTEREAVVMQHVRVHGYPAPDVFDASGADLVMERLHGTRMLDDLGARPWRMRRHCDTWIGLHRRLREVPVGDLAARGVSTRFGPPHGVLHLDFHPANVMLTANGPVVIDWTNAALGPPAADVAMAWVIAATSTIEEAWWIRAVAGALRRRFVDRFVDGCGRADATAVLAEVADDRLDDPNVRPEEAERIRSLVPDLGSISRRGTDTWRG